MNYKRAFATGIMLWVFIFMAISILMFVPILLDKTLTQFIIFWILLIPAVLLLGKWYFKMDAPSLKKGFILGIILLFTVIVLDVIITVPLFVKSYTVFFRDWMIYVEYSEILLLCIYAGFEFDRTYTKREKID